MLRVVTPEALRKPEAPKPASPEAMLAKAVAESSSEQGKAIAALAAQLREQAAAQAKMLATIAENDVAAIVKAQAANQDALLQGLIATLTRERTVTMKVMRDDQKRMTGAVMKIK